MTGEPFERLNFFNGLYTDEKDWQAVERYHRDKRKLHNLKSHGIGIVYGLEVKAGKNGKSYCVEAGLAIDGDGNEIWVREDTELRSLEGDEYQDGGTVYIILEYEEELIKPRQVINSEKSIEAYILEKAKISDSFKTPDNFKQIELARIRLTSGWERIEKKSKAELAKHNQIDHDNRKLSGPNSQSIVLKAEETISAGIEKPIVIEKILLQHDEEVHHRFYVASVHHVGDTIGARISWKIISIRESNYLEYALSIKNESQSAAQIAYEVRRLF